MFAKLKKKIETEAGSVSASDPNSRSTTIVSPNRRDSISSLPGRDGPSPPTSVTSEDPSLRDVSSARDDLMALLQKKSEQCRRLEGKVSDLAALAKEKSKTIDKLEVSLKHQDEVLAKKLQEQKEEFEAYRDKLVEGYQSDKLKLDQEKKELQNQLTEASTYRDKYFRKEEESDEFEGLTTQELAKVKHLLINTEQELTKCKSDLETKTHQCQTAEKQVEKLTDELVELRQKFTSTESERQKLKEENNERAELVTHLTKEKTVFDKRLDETNKEMAEKINQISKLQAQLADLEGEHKTLIRNSDLQRNKTSKALQEKDDELDLLKERIAMLQQRISDSSLSGDDRTSALQAERDQMERKLAEARQQLTEVKSTWSDKITHLEEQISHLNAKIMEDSEELSNKQKTADQMQKGFLKQTEDLKNKLEEAEKRALENLELAASKDRQYEKDVQNLEIDLNKQKVLTATSENESRSKISELETDLSDLKETRKAENDKSKSEISDLEDNISKLETEKKTLEQQIYSLQASVKEREDNVTTLQKHIKEKDHEGEGQSNIISSLRSQINQLEIKAQNAVEERNTYERHLKISEEEKGGLLDKNADLYHQMEGVKKSEKESKLELQRTLELKSQGEANMHATETSLRQRIAALESQIEESEISKAETGLYSTRIDEMSETITSLQSQLADKTRTVKKQEQMLKDLRVTLQRELKVQALPNDEPVDSNVNNVSPLPSSSSPSMNRKSDSPHRPEPLITPRPQPSLQNMSNFHQSGSVKNAMGGNLSPAVLSLQCSPNYQVLTSSSSSVPSGAINAFTTNSGPGPTKEVNVQYLKHVVLKFMLSRESEAIQLIKAVSMLLNFTIQEQQLLRETLEWKMSWFGARPPLGRGQMSKVIPPSF